MKQLAALAFALLVPVFASAQYNSYTRYAVGTAPSYEGLWWNSAESGWGISIAHQGDVLFAVWYTFDHDGSPTWFVMPDARLVPDEMDGMTGMGDMEMMMGMSRNPPLFSGPLYRPSMSAGKLVMTEVGMGTLMFKERERAIFAYSVGNFSDSKIITKMIYGSDSQTCTLGGSKGTRENYSDLWFNPADTGWGVNIAHQGDNRGDVLFATYYTYDANGKAVWFAMSDVREGDMMSATVRGYGGVMARATGPSFDSAWDSSKVKVTAWGSGEFRFDSSGRAEFGATPFGSATAPRHDMTRMQFAAPATVCR